ncbi:hypothetical protein XELAEV_18009293mg [Xenopus laevis]|uniref:Reverse transcriptase domain-containing protein n=1 Tax=Xenopus laevis TaxID=8355 RepID=A0A974I0P4_XENLA|nr:hypothetical protein XELAEV_18009293mg [Xenopus laevis]
MGRWLSFGGYYGKWFVPRNLQLPQHCWREIPVKFVSIMAMSKLRSEDSSKIYGWLENEAGREEIMKVLLACQRALGVVTTEEADAETAQAASPSGSAVSVLTAASLKKKAVHRKRPALPIGAGKKRPAKKASAGAATRSGWPSMSPPGLHSTTLNSAVVTVGEQVVLPSYSGTSASGLIVSPSIPYPIFPSVFPTTTIDAIMPSMSHVPSASHVPSTSHVSANADAIQQAESSSAEGTKDTSILQLLGNINVSSLNVLLNALKNSGTLQKSAGVSETAFHQAIICQTTPLRLHLSSLVKEKIIRGEYVDLLSLLPSAKEFVQTEKKGDSEEDRRRPVAFCINCNILTEKYPGLAPKLFRHLDIVLEAYRSYGRVAWPLSNFSNQKSQMNAQGQSNAQNKYNTCWAYNESHCKWQKFQGIGRGGARDQQGKLTHPGEATRNAALSKAISQPTENSTNMGGILSRICGPFPYLNMRILPLRLVPKAGHRRKDPIVRINITQCSAPDSNRTILMSDNTSDSLPLKIVRSAIHAEILSAADRNFLTCPIDQTTDLRRTKNVGTLHTWSENRTNPRFVRSDLCVYGQLQKEKGSFRLIHHLSYTKGLSVNDAITPEMSSVSYESFDDAVELVRQCGKGFHFEGQFFYDTCLPMGCSLSCNYFELFSSFLEWVVKFESGNNFIVHYLDDFLFVGPKGTQTCSENYPSPDKASGAN